MPADKNEAIAACLAKSMEERLEETPTLLPRLGWWAKAEQFISKAGEIFTRGLQERIPEAVKEFFHSRENRREEARDAEMER